MLGIGASPCAAIGQVSPLAMRFTAVAKAKRSGTRTAGHGRALVTYRRQDRFVEKRSCVATAVAAPFALKHQRVSARLQVRAMVADGRSDVRPGRPADV